LYNNTKDSFDNMLLGAEETAPAADTCTCPGTENCVVQCSDNCSLTATNMNNYNVLINGTGNLYDLRNITNATRIRIQGGCVARW